MAKKTSSHPKAALKMFDFRAEVSARVVRFRGV